MAILYSINQEHECLVEGPLNNLKQSMVQFQKPKKVLLDVMDIVTKFNCSLCSLFLLRHFDMSYVVNVAQIYNERRLFYGGGAGIVPNDTFGSVGSSPNSDRRGPRSRGMLFLSVFIYIQVASQ